MSKIKRFEVSSCIKMDISPPIVLYSITIAYLAFKFLTWLVKYIHRVIVINKIKGPFIIPFIGNIYQVKQYDHSNLLS